MWSLRELRGGAVDQVSGLQRAGAKLPCGCALDLPHDTNIPRIPCITPRSHPCVVLSNTAPLTTCSRWRLVGNKVACNACGLHHKSYGSFPVPGEAKGEDGLCTGHSDLVQRACADQVHVPVASSFFLARAGTTLTSPSSLLAVTATHPFPFSFSAAGVRRRGARRLRRRRARSLQPAAHSHSDTAMACPGAGAVGEGPAQAMAPALGVGGSGSGSRRSPGPGLMDLAGRPACHARSHSDTAITYPGAGAVGEGPAQETAPAADVGGSSSSSPSSSSPGLSAGDTAPVFSDSDSEGSTGPEDWGIINNPYSALPQSPCGRNKIVDIPALFGGDAGAGMGLGGCRSACAGAGRGHHGDTPVDLIRGNPLICGAVGPGGVLALASVGGRLAGSSIGWASGRSAKRQLVEVTGQPSPTRALRTASIPGKA